MNTRNTVSNRKTATKVTTNSDGVTIVRYHQTNVVMFDPKYVWLDTGGWKTVTTKARMNATSHQYGLGYGVFQRDHKWFVTTKAGTFPMGRSVVIDRTSGILLAKEA